MDNCKKLELNLTKILGFEVEKKAVPSSAQLRLASTTLEFCTSPGCLLSQLWLDLEVWVNCSLETTDTVLGLDEIAE